jgi:hypothetical protein
MDNDLLMDADRNRELGDGERLCARLITDIHDVRVPVSDPWVSRGWYMSTLGFESVLDLQEAEGLVGVVLRHPSGFVVGLHRDPYRAQALKGFVLFSLEVRDRDDLEVLAQLFEETGVTHSVLEEGHLGWYLDLVDPDGILTRLHTTTSADAEEA